MELPGVSDHHGGIDIQLPLNLDAARQEKLRERSLAAVENYRVNAD